MIITNTLAYNDTAIITAVKSFIVLAWLGVCTVKLFTAVIYDFRNKLECLSLATLSSLV
jgi:hypothetical protein